MSTPEPSRRTLRQHAAPALLALRTYWPAMLTIQCLALTLVICYYQIDQTAQFFTTIASWKTQGGLLASALCTLISGGLFPELIKRIFRDPTQKAPGAGELAHQFTMWAIIGIKVDLFYRFQALIFGTGTDALTVLSKVMADQLLFTPLVAMNFVVIWFMLYETQYDVKRLVQQLSFSTLANRIIPLWMSALTFWPIFLAIVYSLPKDLQFPLFLFGNATHSILLIFIARRQTAERESG